MGNHRKLVLAAIMAAAILGAAVSAASARNFEITNWERGFRIVWSTFRIEAGGREVACPITLEGTFSRHTFIKSAGNEIGRVTAAGSGTCARGGLTLLRETLPWDVTYNSFGGTLPNIGSITVNVFDMAFQTNMDGIVCLARTMSERPGRFVAAFTGASITGVQAEAAARIETRGGFFCVIAGEASFSGNTNSVTVRGGTERISVRLI
ncbi:MAG TPA: hypothetical protein VN635_12045 [Conexibacter sp.]|nr:hypothetical protein [Conexibacter sp.]